MNKILTARAPAKLIISGEHAVLYGIPAIAMAVNRYTEVTTAWCKRPFIHFKLLNLAYAKSHTLQALKILREQLQKDYLAFLNGQCTIKKVLKRPFELLQYSVSSLIEHLNFNLPRGLEIKVNSTIPIGCGMGSSAAAVVSTVYALSNFLKLNLDINSFVKFGREIENLQHGYSSGLDIHLATFGGCIQFLQGETTAKYQLGMPFYIVNTGKPLATTGECVSFVKSKFSNNQLVEDFKDIVQQVDKALVKNNIVDFQQAIMANNRLLNYIGVVPAKVSSFISKIELLGGAAKICGAGSIKGENGGIVMVVIQNDNLILDKVCSLVDQYGYKLEPIQVDNHGIKIM